MITLPTMSGDAASAVHVDRGDSLLLGARQVGEGTKFSAFSRNATEISIEVYDPGQRTPRLVIPLDQLHHRTGDVWHACVSPSLVGKEYAIRVGGPFRPELGHRFDGRVALLDPFAVAVRTSANGVRGYLAHHKFDWGDDRPPNHTWEETVIYETHVRGLTIHPSSQARHPGQYLGVIEKIPYLKELGVTAVELMPCQEYFDWEPRLRSASKDPVRNYWGYNPVALFAPKTGFASSQEAAVSEFKTMVRELHRADIEVILDVVFNHTAEGSELGPTVSFRGLENAVYYMLGPEGEYLDYTGCGNTLNCNHPVVRSLIIDCLRHWTVHMHVDGFRFDLASVLGRGPEGELLPNPPLLEQIAEDPVLRHVKLIAEAWDAGGALQVGGFPGRRWAEWNSHFRDDVRRFWRGDPGMTGPFAMRLCGSADLYQHAGERPVNSVNFITSHDGFTLSDLVGYARKHNEANGEENRDGVAENFSENNGVEGVTADPEIKRMRLQQTKNLLVSLFVSRGVPMLLGGDEFGRTQRGNNNAYCQDNEVSWYDWRLADTNAGLLRFVRGLIAFRKAHPVLRREEFYAAEDVAWLGADGHGPEWHARTNRVGLYIKEDEPGPRALCLFFNAGSEACRFRLPPAPANAWCKAIDTAAPAPNDICEPGLRADAVDPDGIVLAARSTLVLVSGARQ